MQIKKITLLRVLLAITYPILILLLATATFLSPEVHESVMTKEFLGNITGTVKFGQFTQAENEHLNDVIKVMRAGSWIVLALFLTWTWLYVKNPDPRILIIGGTLAVLVVFVLAFVPFQTLFHAMHKPLFEQGTWEFGPESKLIQAYPIKFWQFSGKVLGIKIITAGILSIVTGFLLSKAKV